MSANEPEISINNNDIKENDQSLLDDISNYIMDKKLGEGRFSKVYLATHKLTSEQVAIKIIFKKDDTSKGALSHIKSEIDILKRAKHNNIGKLFSVIETNERIYLVQEYIEGKDLSNFITQSGKIQSKIKKVCYFFRQIISAMEYMDTLGIAHRDLKPENILINEKYEIKLVDFGLGSIYKINNNNKLLKTRCGSPFYCAPEMILGKKYCGNLSDIWSLGIILYYMIFNELPFYEVDLDRLYKKIIDGKYTIPKDKANIVGKDAIDLINKMLEKDPKKRIKINDIIKHNWFNNEKNVLYIGLNIEEIIIPIDEEILSEIVNNYGYDINVILNCILKNEFNKITSIYLILLEKKIINGEKSVADLKSDLYLNYIKDEKNKLINFDNNIENVILEKLKYYEKFNNIFKKKESNKDNIAEKKDSITDIDNNKNDKRANNINNSEYSKKNQNNLSIDFSNNKNKRTKSCKKSLTTKNVCGQTKFNKLKIIIETKIKSNNDNHIATNKKYHKQKKIFKKHSTDNFKGNNKKENKDELESKQNNNKNNKINKFIKSEVKNNSNKEKDSNKKSDISYKKSDKLKSNLKIETKLELSSSNKKNVITNKSREIKKRMLANHNHKSIDISEIKHKGKERILSLYENNFKKLDNSKNNTTINKELSRNKKKKIKDLLIRKSDNNNNSQNIKDEILKKNIKNSNKGNNIKHNHLTYLTQNSNFHKENKEKKKSINFYSTQTNFYKSKLNDSKKSDNKKSETLKNSYTKNIKENNDTENINNKTNFTSTVSPIKKRKKEIKIKERIKTNKINNKYVKKINDIINNNDFVKPFDLNFIYIFKDDKNAKIFIEKKLKNKKIKFFQEKNRNYLCSKLSGLKFNIELDKYKHENNMENNYVYIFRIKNEINSSNYDFFNFVKSFYKE